MCSRPGRVDDRHVASAGPRGLDGVEGDRGRVRPARRADEVGARALRPDLELLLGGRAKRVGGPDEHRAPVLVQLARELADRRRLPRAVDADDEDHAGLGGQLERRRLAEERLDLADERVFEVPGDSARFEPPHELGCRGDADVAPDERLLESLPRLVVGRVERGRRELGGQCLAALRERLAHARRRSPCARARPLGAASSPRSSDQVAAHGDNLGCPVSVEGCGEPGGSPRLQEEGGTRGNVASLATVRRRRTVLTLWLRGRAGAAGGASTRPARRRRGPSSRRRGYPRPPSSSSGA